MSGCVVRTYPCVRDRVDQDLSTGNHGYISGSGPAVQGERKTTRTTETVEIELRPLIKFDGSKGKHSESAGKEAITGTSAEESAEGNKGYLSQSVSPEMAEPKTQTQGSFEKYTVQKNDTLQKISSKFYGTTKRWKKIFNANSDVLKTANSIRPGQVLNIPTEGLKETKENLK